MARIISNTVVDNDVEIKNGNTVIIKNVVDVHSGYKHDYIQKINSYSHNNGVKLEIYDFERGYYYDRKKL